MLYFVLHSSVIIDYIYFFVIIYDMVYFDIIASTIHYVGLCLTDHDTIKHGYSELVYNEFKLTTKSDSFPLAF